MEKAKALDRMMNLCSRREYCIKDIRAKLAKMEAEDPEGIIEKLCKDKYLDEFRYASAFARDKSSLQGWGIAKIRLNLQAKGIPNDTISEALLEIDADKADARLESLLKTKLRTLNVEDERERFMKVVRFALGRGYSYQQIKKTYDIIRTT